MKYSFLMFFVLITSLNPLQFTHSTNVYPATDSVKSLDSTEVITKEEDTPKEGSTFIDSTELIIRKLTIYSGKRPSTEEVENAKEKYWLLRIHFTSVIYASRIIDITRDGKELHLPFDPIMSFETSEEALNYAKKNGIEDVLIE